MTDPPPMEELRRQYDRALDEYRFQVDLNWRRSEYFFVLNVGVLIAAATMFSGDVPRVLVAVMFLIGVLLAVLSVLANEAQHSYYRSARALKLELEQRMQLGDLALATTPGMGSSFGRLGRVRTFLKIMLIAIALVDLGGAAFAAADAVGGSEPDPESARTLVLEVERPQSGSWSALAVSQNGEPAVSRRLKSVSPTVLLQLPPGEYLVSLAGRTLCEKRVEVSRRPLQRVALGC